MADILFTSISEQNRYLALGILGLAVLAYVYSAFSTPLAKVPGPWYSLFTGQVLKYYGVAGKRAKYVHDLHEKYGPIVRVGPEEVDVADVASVKEIHTVKATYTKSPKFYSALKAPGENVFNTVDIQYHRQHRKLLSGGFSDASLQSFHPIVEGRVNLAIERMAREMETRGVADVFKWWLFMATDVIGELTFGQSFRMLEHGEKNEYSRNLEKIAVTGAKRSAFPFLAKLAFYGVPIPGFGENTQVLKNNIKFATQLLQQYQSLVEQDPNVPVPSLFKRLFKEEEEASMSFNEILAEAQVYIIAGSDTTALTLTYLVWRVCGLPEVREKLVKELQQLPVDYHDKDLQHLPYLNQVIEESLRLHAPAPSALPRVVPPGGATLSGHYLPGGSIVCTQAWTLHRDPEVFPDPEKFDPSRWVNPTKEMKDLSMPFGGGSRICLGLHLARLELRLATARFFRAFPNAERSTREGMTDDDMQQMLYFLAPPKGKRCLIECS
ncbi:cytochrome P450 [Cryphonectria parasitica EP155]|uniref:Cytochrome P450 n=1 Tax=Cryphonectria parasitica (strain ATCC 38755 / EP155) TaxID=660469 RepID=A0A9P4XUD6_CRYP1|nr:cytochrome P450 [Cryphonectria parasitica EP155]KAF3760962.1 cytochrome P450 [Cryphonectria parasitica EP155]